MDTNNLTTMISIIGLPFLFFGILPLLNSSVIYASNEEILRSNSVNGSSFSIFKPTYSLLDPNPSLIDKDGNLINNINLAAKIKEDRKGTIADGISKLILVIDSKNKLQFSINGTTPDNLTNGVLSSLNQSSNAGNLLSAAIINSQTVNGRSVVVAVYTPPDSFNQNTIRTYRTINILIFDPNNPSVPLLEVPIQLYKPPVVLIHGIWTNSYKTCEETNFTKTLNEYGFKFTPADYEEHNSEAFDPYENKTIGNKPFGNYGINATRTAIYNIFKEYHNNLTAASQVDIVAHSMGGLMARGFVQQADYKNKSNFMVGSVHRLITIGTPHFGGNLSKILDYHSNKLYCPDFKTPPQDCERQLEDLKTIYEKLGTPLHKGGVKALIPGSDAYSHLCQTNVSSYAIVGNWKDNAVSSHNNVEKILRYITNNSAFSLEKDGFSGDNDLVVSITSQLGGLPNQTRNAEGKDLPDKSAVYSNIVHAPRYIQDKNISSETNSPDIQQDVIRLLGSSGDNKFADAIGKGSPCHVPE